MFPFTDLLDAHREVVTAFFAVGLVYNLVIFFVGGRKAERRFRGQEHQPVRFRERGASGYSTRSLITRFGGASRALDVTITDTEVWLKGIWPPFTFIGTLFDLTHRIPRPQIRSVEAKAGKVDLRFLSEAGVESHVVLILKDTSGFMAAVGR